ncbi:S8 family serine peptidase [Bacillus toyonensis]|uniref:S8 family serine peptidase n=1 Tax=Bacillus toyonensis TaxID=155322 RepID=UPI0014443FC9|nr:S8 family serine peptidase [Bacillus toyonensis]NKW96566.1 S8 family serine peptidase [Bacillus toyonensis]
MKFLVISAAGNKRDGNKHTKEVEYTVYYPEVVFVGSVNMCKKLSQFTITHDEVDSVTPGEKILSTYTNAKRYVVLRGTTMATPHAVGTAALLLKHHEKKFNENLTESEIFIKLIK